ncbi:MAG: AAA family ATPase, partial [Christensenellaceae bacterium]|nr:AAA family ATPase [Christensenellaceae bacterium]
MVKYSVQAFKKLEVYGFKSFADKLEVDFSGGITAIVGPNGCGKSNVSDAVRWVLGEQSSKTLRGTNMQDVIFKGTEARKPLGYCEVSLYFDNTEKIFPVDYSEVVITRKLFKSGESEYFINRQPSRLKDINHLMHDCGVDRDGLTIISQGQVSDIITGKPEMRRGVFEEAAGIAKFKSKKVEAERKLERTTADLDRVKIVTDEIEKNLTPLLKQAKAAEEYVALRDGLKNIEVAVFVTQYDTAAGEKEKFVTQMARINTQIKDRQTSIATASAEIGAKNDEINALDREAEFLRGQVLDLSVGAEREQNNKRIEIIEKINILKQDRAALLSRKRVIENLIESGEGYKMSVRKLLETKNKNIVGVVAKELSVPKELEAAVEVALGAAAQNIITHDEDGAKQLIEYLRRENSGRATFLPLTAAKEKILTREEERFVMNRRYVLGVASDLVKYKSQITPVVQALLGRTVVVDSLENAIELARDMRYSAKIVTLDGDVIETRGSITGGS